MRRPVVIVLPLLPLLVLCLCCADAYAQQDPRTDSAPDGVLSEEELRRNRFRAAVRRATACYESADYECALAAYIQAHEINPRPLLLFNIAQVHRKAGRQAEAVMYFDRFLASSPDTNLRPEVERYIQDVQSVPRSSSDGKIEIKSRSTDNFTGTEEQRAELFQRHVASGVSNYQAGEYESAIAEYWAAYTLRSRAILLFNIAQAYRKLKRWPEARALFMRFVKEEPKTPLFGEVEAYLVEVQAQLEKESIVLEKIQIGRIADANTKLTERLANLILIEHDRQHAQKITYPKTTPLHKRRIFWGLLGGAIGVATVAICLGIGLSNRLPTPDFGKRMLEF